MGRAHAGRCRNVGSLSDIRLVTPYSADREPRPDVSGQPIQLRCPPGGPQGAPGRRSEPGEEVRRNSVPDSAGAPVAGDGQEGTRGRDGAEGGVVLGAESAGEISLTAVVFCRGESEGGRER
jgi:hypothetical protein